MHAEKNLLGGGTRYQFEVLRDTNENNLILRYKSFLENFLNVRGVALSKSVPGCYCRGSPDFLERF